MNSQNIPNRERELMTPEEELILIVDDERDIRDLLSLSLTLIGFKSQTAANAPSAIHLLSQSKFSLILIDLHLPQISGMELLKVVRETYPDVAVIIATGSDDRKTAIQAMHIGAYDFIVKPFDIEELAFSIRRALEKRHLALEVASYQQSLEEKVIQRTKQLEIKHKELEGIILNVIQSIVVMLEARDEYTAHHSHRVANLAVQLATKLGLEGKQLSEVRLAALLHDIGKIGIRESILHKTEPLTDKEMDHIKTHPLIAEQILRPIKQLESIIPAIKHEHEAYNGTGYPDGLAGEEIPLIARIISVVDAYDALTSQRSFRSALPHNIALQILLDGAGQIWDPQLVSIFKSLVNH
jgi:putative nucleotidyltransferase with HDIG domain